MILRRLYELAEWANLLTDPSVEVTRVACVVKIGKSGQFNGLLDVRQDVPKGKKTVKAGGLPLPVPLRAVIWDIKAKRWKVTDPAGNGEERPAAFLADTIARVLPVDQLIREAAAKKKGANPDAEVDKCRRQRSTFWRFIRYTAEQTGHATLKGLTEFGDRVLADDPELVAQVAAEIETTGLSASQGLCTLERTADDGPALNDRDVLVWWRGFYEADASAAQAELPVGVCQVTHQRAPLSSSVTVRVNGLTPIGCRADAYLVVGLDSADSYGLKGAQAGMVSPAGIDGFTRAVHALLANQLPNKRAKGYVGGMRSSMRVGGTQFLFWTRDMEGSSGVEILDAKPDEFAGLLEVINTPVVSGPDAIAAPDEFRILALGGNSARVVVRDYLERPLGEVRTGIRKWFADLSIADTSKEYQGRANAAFPLWMLATATALEADRVAPDTQTRLMHAALTGGPLPDSILAACVTRLRAEGSDGFRPARMALVKLCLNRTHCQENPMTPTCDENRSEDRAYACGRLLAFLARCQSPKDFGAGAQLLERFFGTASTAPRAVFPTLLRLNRHHIAKIRDEMAGFAVNLETELEERVAPLRPTADRPADFPALLSLAEQGRFSLGFYHQRADYRSESADKKAKAAATAAAAAAAAE
jgi:CRISPR-associated protein Csd1